MAKPKNPEETKPLFVVTPKQSVELRFPDAMSNIYGPIDFARDLSAAEAREISAAPKAAAAEIE